MSGWVNTLYAGPGGGSKGFEFFKIGMELSVEGLGYLFSFSLIIKLP